MRRPHIIGLTGPKGAGKSTAAELLCKHAQFSGLAFGDALRSELCNAFAVDIELFTRPDLKDKPTKALALDRNLSMEFNGAIINYFRGAFGDEGLLERMTQPRSPREVMILWAEQYRKPLYGPDYFRRKVVARVHLEQSQHQWRHVIHDVRFANEAEAIRMMGGAIWQIKRPGCVADPADPTETDGRDFVPDLVINNLHDTKHLQALVLGHWMMNETGLAWHDLLNIGQTHALAQVA
jgi:hypothetical protein